MKNYNKLILISVVFYSIMAVLVTAALNAQQEEKGRFYKVEINRILAGIEGGAMPEELQSIDLQDYKEVFAVAYLPASETDREVVMDFYGGINGMESIVYPLYTKNSTNNISYNKKSEIDSSLKVETDNKQIVGNLRSALPMPEQTDNEQIAGYLRFDCQQEASGQGYFLTVQAALLLMEVFLLGILFYLKRHLIQPFCRMQDMTYDMSKGNLQGDIKADRNQYFGKFLWGIGELKDALSVSRKRELELLREKKLLLLSLSHDIKTPLSMIKLYARALEDGIYQEAREQQNAYRQIGEKTVQIENLVSEIMRASKEDIVQIEVEKGEFYLKELMGWVASVYGEKCALRKCELTIGTYQNRIFQGDIHRLREVFGNLFENAFKYGDCRRIQVSFYEEDYCQLIRVFNTGEPVTQKEFVHLFDSFFRGENTRGQQGNGLGLYICREIMHRLDGEIFAVCEDDGMAFVVVLPL